MIVVLEKIMVQISNLNKRAQTRFGFQKMTGVAHFVYGPYQKSSQVDIGKDVYETSNVASKFWPKF